LAASIERSSEHPLANAIVNAANQKSLKPGSAMNFQSVTGKGVKGTVEGKSVILGNLKMLQDAGVAEGDLAISAKRLRDDGQTVMYLAVDGTLAGLLGVSDPVKQSTPSVVDKLSRENVRIVMLTGDNPTTAQAVARKVNVSDVRAEVL